MSSEIADAQFAGDAMQRAQTSPHRFAQRSGKPVQVQLGVIEPVR
jgi:hypothetical protein